MAEYPKRESFFANRLVRMLHKSCAANDMGIEATHLVTVIVMVEDAKRYAGPVTFYNGQLLPITGFASWSRLNRARDSAVEAGWLHYESRHRKSGVYWALVPDSVARTVDDSPVDEDVPDHQNGEQVSVDHQNRKPNGESNGEQVVTQTVNHLPIPSPVPITCSKLRSNDLDSLFERFWNAYSKKTAKPKAKAAFTKAVKADSTTRNVPLKDSAEHIINVAVRYGANFKVDRKFQKHPTTWLNGECWNDDPTTWPSVTDPTADQDDDWRHVHEIVRSIYQPDIRNAAEVEGKLTPEQFAAATTVTLKRIANADKFDMVTAEAYRTARKEIA